MKDFLNPNRKESKTPASKGHDVHSANTNSKLPASTAAVDRNPLPPAARRIRNRSVSDGVHSSTQQTKVPSPSDPTILSVLDEEEITTCSSSADLLERGSPGTPPKKLWERQYGVFLRHRNRAVDNLSTKVEPLPPPSPNSQDSSVRGGKLFASVFRQSASDSVLNKGRGNSSADDLDGTLRRGADRAIYSPRSNHRNKSITSQSTANATWGTPTINPLQLARSGSGGTGSSSFLQPKISVRENFYEENMSSSLFYEAEDALPPAPPLLLPPKAVTVQWNQQQASTDEKLKAGDMSPSSHVLNKTSQPRSFSSEMKLAFTKIRHSTGEDVNSVFLGDDPSVSNRNTFFAHKNLRLDTQSNTNLPELELGPLEPIQETVSVKSKRCLKPFEGVETWKTGCRYLIAPAALAACPVAAINCLFGNSCTPTRFAFNDSITSGTDPRSVFGMIVLGECLLSYVTGSHKSHTTKEWTSAQLVLRQNYLLEYDVDANVHTDIPRGFAHLENAQTVLHEHFKDALELNFYGSPCSKTDARRLMIRISQSSTNNIDDSVHLHPEIRVAWQSCLNRASALLRTSDLYEYDECNLLGKGQYSEVRAAYRRTDGSLRESDSSAATYDCAIKIFNKDKFWRRVVKGRERADTIVRETAVQSTLLARCSNNPSFLRIRGFFETSKEVVLELELLDGTDLFKYVSSKTVLKEQEAALILRDVLRCLYDMSKNGLAHRDIKPANILMCGNAGHSDELKPSVAATRVKVGDFGMATFVGVDGQLRGRCGTPGYVAPEIFTAGVYGGYGNKVDIFSAGVTLYVMLCGYEPFYGETDEELKEANKAAVVEFPTDDWSSVSSEAKDLVKQMMHPDPAKRLDAGQALEHPWIVKNVPVIKEDEHYTDLQSWHRDDACLIS